MKNNSITGLFNKFAGKEISVNEKIQTRTSKLSGETLNFTTYSFADENDPLLVEMHQIAVDNGVRLRIWLPNTMGTMDYRMDRVNTRVAKGADGKYRFSDFKVG
jgi:hypothetical protein